MFSAKSIKLTLYSGLLVLVILAVLGQLFFNSSSSRFDNTKELIKAGFQGEVVNQTSRPLLVTSLPHRIELPPGTRTSDQNMKDIDAIVVDRPMQLDGKLYTSGFLTFCDMATMTVVQDGDTLLVKPSLGAFVCKLTNRYGHYTHMNHAYFYNQ